MYSIAILASALSVVTASSACDPTWVVFSGRAIASNHSLASYANVPELSDCRAKCKRRAPKATGISHSGYFKTCDCYEDIFAYYPVWSKAVDLKATAMISTDNCAFAAEGDVNDYDVSNFKGTFDECSACSDVQ